jgi:hypothetical protein
MMMPTLKPGGARQQQPSQAAGQVLAATSGMHHESTGQRQANDEHTRYEERKLPLDQVDAILGADDAAKRAFARFTRLA